MSLDPLTGIISGTPTAPGVYTAQITVCNIAGLCITAPATITVNAASSLPLAASYANASGTTGVPLVPVLPVAAAGGPVTTAALASGALPGGVTLDPATGQVAGTPAAAGAFPVQIALGNASGAQITVPFTLTVSAPSATILAAAYADANGVVGSPLTVAPGLLSGGPVTRASLTGGSLPLGMMLGQDGRITGIPQAVGTSVASITLSNASGGQTTIPASISVTSVAAAPLVASYLPAVSPVGRPITPVLPTLASGGPIVGAVLVSGGLPAGLALDPATGAVTGTPTATGTFQVQIRLCAGSGACTLQVLTLTIAPNPPSVTAPDLTTTVGQTGIETPVNAGGAITGATLVAGGPFPAGVALRPDGTLREDGTTPVGVFGPFTIRYCNDGGCADASLRVRVLDLPPVVSPLTVTEAYGATATLAPAHTGGAITGATITTGGALPSGLTLQADGTLAQSGLTPAGTYGPYSISFCNSGGCASAAVTVTIVAAPAVAPLSVVEAPGATTLLTPVNTGGAITGATITAGGSLPAGLTLRSDGSIAQTGATAAGAYGPYTISYCNAGGCVSSTAAVTILAPPSVSPLSVQEALGDTTTLTPANGGGAITSATLTAGGALPAGLALQANGTLTQTGATPAGTYGPYTISYCNASGCVSSSVTVAVIAAPAVAPLSVLESPGTTTTLTPVNTGGAITSATVTSGGPLASGLALASNGTIAQSGTTASGAYGPYTVRYCNVAGCVSSTVSVTISAKPAVSPLTVTETQGDTTTLIPVNNGGAITSATVTGGGPLAAGLTLQPNGSITQAGTTPAGTYVYTVTYGNAAGTASATVTLTVLSVPTANLASNPSVVPVDQASSLTILFSGSANGTAQLSGDGITGSLTVTSGTSVSTGIVTTPGTTRNYLLTVSNGAGGSASSSTSVQWVPAPSDTWTVTIPATGAGSPFTPGGGSLLNNLIAISVPDQGQTTCGDVTLTVNREASLPGAIPGTAAAYSQAFNIASSVGYPFRVPITITLAYDNTLSGANDIPMPFYWDPSYGNWVAAGLGKVDTTAHTVTFQTLLPGRYAVLGIPNLALATKTVGNPVFKAGTDDWLQNDPSNYDLPGGASLGMSSFASWFFTDRKGAGAGLYKTWVSASDSNAAALISRLGNGTLDSWASLWNQSSNHLTGVQTGLALITGLMVTGQPQILLMSDSPAQSSAVATAVYGYNFTTGTFSVMDPNYPGDTLTLAWNSSTGAFSAYDRSQGYAPALAQYAFGGQTGIHRQSDYDTLFTGAQAGFPAATYATVDVTGVSGAVNTPLDLSSTVVVASSTNVQVTGTVTNGDQQATAIYWSQNGSSPRTAVPLVNGAFTFTIPALDNPYGTTIALETTSNPCDPTFSHSGFRQFTVQQQNLPAWFLNPCFEQGGGTHNTNPWVLSHGSNTSIFYPWQHSGSSNNNPVTFSTTAPGISDYVITWTQDNNGSAASTALTPTQINALTNALANNSAANGTGLYSALVYSPDHAADAQVPTPTALPTAGGNGISMVLNGDYSLMVNDPVKGNHVSKATQTIQVPASVNSPKLTFYWAGATQSGGHTPDQSPFIDILVQDADANYEVLYYVHHFAPTTVSGTTYTDGYPGWISSNIQTGGSGTTYVWWGINWQKVSLNLGTGRPNHHIVLTVMAAGCEPSGHAGYAYLDSMVCE